MCARSIATENSQGPVIQKEEAVSLGEYWTEGSEPAESINEYIASVTDENSPDFIPVEKRTAVFDLDGSYYGENAKMSKVDAIVREIGEQPVLAFGNSSGDLAMELYTISDNPYKSAAFMVLADDEERENGDAAAAEEKRASYEKQGIGVISMKDDFKTIYGEGVVKAEP